jgi:hypothetical protein
MASARAAFHATSCEKDECLQMHARRGVPRTPTKSSLHFLTSYGLPKAPALPREVDGDFGHRHLMGSPQSEQ